MIQQHITSLNSLTTTTDALIVGAFANKTLLPTAQKLDQASGGYLKKRIEAGDFKGRVGETLLLFDVPHIAAERVILVGLGEPKLLREHHYLKATQSALELLKSTGSKKIIWTLCEIDIPHRDRTRGNHCLHWKLRQAAQMVADTAYRFDRFKKARKDEVEGNKAAIEACTLTEVFYPLPDTTPLESAQRTLRETQAICLGKTLTKDLGNLPSNVCTPTYFVEQAKQLAAAYPSLHINVIGADEARAIGMHAFLAVAQGSHQPPHFIVLEYRGTDKNESPIVLVGKGVTFDSGGISIKPAARMDEMKMDMLGAASVLGTFKAVAELKLPIRLVGLMPLVENLPGGGAYKPGDVIQTLSGQTIEIGNTDAEGRVILSDALTYAERYQPAAVIDIATLTGAIVVALGEHATGMMGNNVALMDELRKAGEISHDRVWELPLWDEYQMQIDSYIADMSNIGVGGGKSITAGCLLSRFTEKYPWVHLDIAGVAWREGKSPWATGRPVSLLVQYLLERCTTT